MAGHYTNQLFEFVKVGLIDRDHVIAECVRYMSEEEVLDLLEQLDCEDIISHDFD